MKIKSIAFVCTANTCRSPMAEYLLKHMLNKEGIQGIEVFSRGVSAWDGSPISTGSREVLKKVGIDGSAHQSGRLTKEDVKRADLILVMQDGHRAAVLGDYPEAAKKTFLLKEYGGDGGGDIGDPIGASLDYYEETRKEIENALLGILKKLKEEKP